MNAVCKEEGITSVQARKKETLVVHDDHLRLRGDSYLHDLTTSHDSLRVTATEYLSIHFFPLGYPMVTDP